MGKGGSPDQSGVQQAMFSAQAAELEYKLGQEQLDWAKQVWGEEQPLINQAEQIQIEAAKSDIAAQQQAEQFAQQQEALYNQYTVPLIKQYTGQAQNWASPTNMALYVGEAQNNVAEQMGSSLNAAKEQLHAYGVNPDAGRMAGLYVGSNVLSGAAQAGAGTSTAQNLRLQQMALEGNAIGVGTNVGNASANLTGVATGAGTGATQGGAGAAGTAQSNLQTGSNAMIAPTAYFDSGARNMGVYTNAVGSLNEAQAQMDQANAMEMMGLGSALGGLFGGSGFTSLISKIAKGGPVVRFDDGGGVDPTVVPGDTSNLPPIRPQLTQPPPPPQMPRPAAPMGIPFNQRTPTQQSIGGPVYQRYQDGGGLDVTSPTMQQGGMFGGNNIAPTAIPRPDVQPGGILTFPSGQRGQVQITRDLPRAPMMSMDELHKQGFPLITNRAEGRQTPLYRNMGGSIYQRYEDGAGVDRYLDQQMLADDQPPLQEQAPAPGPATPQQPVMAIPPSPASDVTPGGGVPAGASPSGGSATDDVHSLLTAGEFVVPKDVAQWKGHEWLTRQVDLARKGMMQNQQRDDIGGEAVAGIPAAPPRFISRPMHTGSTATLAQLPVQGLSGIPPQRQQAQT